MFAKKNKHWTERVRSELTELTDKICRLFNFFSTMRYETLSAEQKDLLDRQFGIMVDYHDILNERIDIHEKEMNEKDAVGIRTGDISEDKEPKGVVYVSEGTIVVTLPR